MHVQVQISVRKRTRTSAHNITPKETRRARASNVQSCVSLNFVIKYFCSSSPNKIKANIGIVKAYTTRVGSGVFSCSYNILILQFCFLKALIRILFMQVLFLLSSNVKLERNFVQMGTNLEPRKNACRNPIRFPKSHICLILS